MISINQLVKQYGYCKSTIKQIWVPKGLDMSLSEQDIRVWIVQEVLPPDLPPVLATTVSE